MAALPQTETMTVPINRQQAVTRTALAVGLLALALWMTADLLPALLWALVVVIAIQPLYRGLEARLPRLRGRALLPALVTLAIGLVVILPIAIGLVHAVGDVHDLIGWITTARRTGLAEPAFLADLPFGSRAASDWWRLNLATPGGAEHFLGRFDTSVVLAHSRLVGRSLVHRVVIFSFMLIALFFLLKDGDAVAEQVQVASDRVLGPAGRRIGRQIVRSVRGTIDGLVLVGIGEGIVMAIVYVVAGVPHPILLGAVTAIAAMIPFGAAVMFALAALLLLIQGALLAAIIVFAVGMLVLLVADHFIRPALIGGATRLPFLWVLIGILGGVESLGLLGLFIGPAVMAVLMLLWRELVDRSEPLPAPPPPPPSA